MLVPAVRSDSEYLADLCRAFGMRHNSETLTAYYAHLPEVFRAEVHSLHTVFINRNRHRCATGKTGSFYYATFLLVLDHLYSLETSTRRKAVLQVGHAGTIDLRIRIRTQLMEWFTGGRPPSARLLVEYLFPLLHQKRTGAEPQFHSWSALAKYVCTVFGPAMSHSQLKSLYTSVLQERVARGHFPSEDPSLPLPSWTPVLQRRADHQSALLTSLKDDTGLCASISLGSDNTGPFLDPIPPSINARYLHDLTCMHPAARLLCLFYYSRLSQDLRIRVHVYHKEIIRSVRRTSPPETSHAEFFYGTFLRAIDRLWHQFPFHEPTKTAAYLDTDSALRGTLKVDALPSPISSKLSRHNTKEVIRRYFFQFIHRSRTIPPILSWTHIHDILSTRYRLNISRSHLERCYQDLLAERTAAIQNLTLP